MKISISLKVETSTDDFAEYEAEVREWDDVEAFVGSTRRAVERAQAIAENVIEDEE